MKQWSPTSWQTHDYQQCATYPSEQHLNEVVNTLSSRPPLISANEVDDLKNQLADAACGKRFVLQGGDCAESFADCNEQSISNKFKILLQMSLVLLYGLRKPITRVGRIAGQYTKPRSTSFETQEDITLPSYRGDLVNGPHFNEKTRIPTPDRLLDGYNFSAITLNYLRALINGGFADLHHPHRWDLSFFQHSEQADEYFSIVQAITDSLDFIQTIDGLQHSSLSKVDFFTSHEALHLHYEQALTREVKKNKWYDLSTHFPWVGMRTASIGSAHVEFLRGIQNPIAIKIGPQINKETLLKLMDILNPDNEPGKLTLITRLGAKTIDSLLPDIIKAVQDNDRKVLWLSDPMHGNTHSTEDGIKTRHFDSILSELQQAIAIHQQHHSILGGVHFELTGDNVTECTGGARDLQAKDLSRAYKTLVDPRLNYEQSLEMALQITQCYTTHTNSQ